MFLDEPVPASSPTSGILLQNTVPAGSRLVIDNLSRRTNVAFCQTPFQILGRCRRRPGPSAVPTNLLDTGFYLEDRRLVLGTINRRPAYEAVDVSGGVSVFHWRYTKSGH
jgi:hypothetical protein